jgi:hypothetical protein
MKHGICPTCGSEAIHVHPDQYGSAGRLYISLFRRVGLTTYVCATCGYVEQYVPDPQALHAIATHWPPAATTTLAVSQRHAHQTVDHLRGVLAAQSRTSLSQRPEDRRRLRVLLIAAPTVLLIALGALLFTLAFVLFG